VKSVDNLTGTKFSHRSCFVFCWRKSFPDCRRGWCSKVASVTFTTIMDSFYMLHNEW